MTPELHQRASDLFLRVCDLPPGDRGPVLDRECGGDTVLRQAVEALLVADPGKASGLELGLQRNTGATGVTGFGWSQEQEDSFLGTSLGPYRIVKRLGEGGMGAVYLAEQSHPIRRQVALKVIKLGMDTKSVIARFEGEREALSLMNHPNVAKVLDAGTTDKGRPYFVMEFVEGVPITTYADEHRLTTADRLSLFMDVCAAVQHAHQKGIIHRDIKPSNVLITEVDRRPIPKVIDFGVAKATQQRLTERSVFTEQGQIIGTPGYISPEQADLTGVDVDTRTDIYSLGVLLYELLTGTLPFDTRSLRAAGLVEMQRIIREVDPPRPSTRLTGLGNQSEDVARNRRTEVRTLAKQLRADLDWVVMKSLEKSRTRRYETADALALDIGHFLRNEPVLAGPPSRAYKLKRFARRNRVALGTAVFVMASLGMGLAIAVAMYMKAEDARISSEAAERTARSEAARSEQILGFVHDFLSPADPHESGRPDTPVSEILNQAAGKLLAETDLDPESLGRVCHIIGRAYYGIGNYGESARFLGQALSYFQHSVSSDGLRMAGLLYDFGWLKHDQRDYLVAERNWQQSLAIRRKLLGDMHGDVAQSLAALADAKKHLGDRDGAQAAFEDAVAIARKSLGPEHVTTIDILNDLGVFYLSIGRQREAESILRDVVAGWEKRFGVNHPRVLQSKANLANTLQDRSKFVEAEKLLREVIREAELKLGPAHPRIGDWKLALARLLLAIGRLDESLELVEAALILSRTAQGDMHQDVTNITADLARRYQAKGDYAIAIRLMAEALDRTQAQVGNNHQAVAWKLVDLGRIFAEAGEEDQAMDSFLQSMDILRQIRGPDDIEISWRFVDIAKVQEQFGHCDGTAKIRRRCFG